MKKIITFVTIGLLLASTTYAMNRIKLTKEEQKKAEIAVILEKITTRTTAGGGQGENWYTVVDPQKLATFLYEITSNN